MEETKITITLDKDGKVHVNGPLTNKILCFGLLEAAKEAVRNFSLEKARILAPVTVLPLPKT
jgi:hypothetical protein